MQFLAVAKDHPSDDAEREEEENLSVVVVCGWVVGEDKRDYKLEQVTEGKCHPVVTVDTLPDLLAEDEQRYVGKDDHQSAEAD